MTEILGSNRASYAPPRNRWGSCSQRRVASPAIVEHLNAFTDCQTGLGVVKPFRAIDELFLQGGEEDSATCRIRPSAEQPLGRHQPRRERL